MNKTQTVTIHKATPADAAAIAALQRQLALHEQMPSDCDTNAMIQLLTNPHEPRCEFLMAKEGNNVLGFALFYPGYDLSSASYGFHLADLVVDTRRRRQSIGTQLVSTLATRALNEGKTWISLTVMPTNISGVSFYQKHGFISVNCQFMAIGANGLSQLSGE